MQSTWERIFFRSNLRRCHGVFEVLHLFLLRMRQSQEPVQRTVVRFRLYTLPKSKCVSCSCFCCWINPAKTTNGANFEHNSHSFCFSTIKFNFPFQRRPNLKLKLLSCGYICVILEQSSTHIKEVGATCVIMSQFRGCLGQTHRIENQKFCCEVYFLLPRCARAYGRVQYKFSAYRVFLLAALCVLTSEAGLVDFDFFFRNSRQDRSCLLCTIIVSSKEGQARLSCADQIESRVRVL